MDGIEDGNGSTEATITTNGDAPSEAASDHGRDAEIGGDAGGAADTATDAGATAREDASGEFTFAEVTGSADPDEEFTFEDVSVVMGTYNEEEAIGTVLSDVDRVSDGKAEVICVDGSTDRTPEIAREHGARVIEQEPQGYGVAVREAILAPDRPVVVTTDCDDTYPMERLPDFLAAINEGHDVVSGDRLYYGAEAMPAFNRLGNHAFAALASLLLGTRVHDTTTGMRAYRREVVESISWSENTGLSAELLIRPLARGYDVAELPIEYRERAGETKLDPIQGGLAIGASILTVCLEERLRALSLD